MIAELKVRRSFLYVAPMYEASLAGASRAGADVLCFDLEDATPPQAKIAARDKIAETLDQGGFGPAERVVRVNALDTEWGHADLVFAAGLPIDGILIPKAEGAATVRQTLHILDGAGGGSLAIWCLIETPLGVLRAEEIANASPRMTGLVIGGADLAEGLNARHVRSRLPMLHALCQTILAARAYGLSPIDAVHLPMDDQVGFEESARQAVDLGFDGKSIFGRDGVAIVNRLFAPAPESVAQARRQVDAWTGYGGHLESARRLLAFHDAVKARDTALAR